MIEYRKATMDDLSGILFLYKQWAQEENVTGHEIDAEKTEAVWRDSEAKGVAYFIAKDAEAVIASCYISIIPNLTWGGRSIGFIENVICRKDYRRQGIGREVIQKAIDYAQKSGCYKVTLQSNAKRRETHNFYRALGFDATAKIAFEVRLIE